MSIEHSATHYDTLRFSFVKMLRLHATRPACWYSITHLPTAGSRNLSSYLGLKPETYNNVLIKLGLAYNHGKHVRISLEKWKHFLVLNEKLLPDSYEVIEYCCYGKSQCQLIKLGGMYDKKRQNPGQEYKDIMSSMYSNLERKYGEVDERGVGECDKLLFALNKIYEMELDCNSNGENEEVGGSTRMSSMMGASNLHRDNDSCVAQYDDGEPLIDIIGDYSKYPILNKLNIIFIKPSTLYMNQYLASSSENFCSRCSTSSSSPPSQ